MTPRLPSSRFPKSWYQIAVSNKIKKAKLYTYNYFGKSLVCFRANNGTVSVFDAHCPHLGAHLGVGGKVDGNHLICPFHGWKFDAAGQCVEIPYCKSIPKRAQLQQYPSQEIFGAIFIYYSDDFRKPEFDLSPFSEKGGSNWGRTQTIGCNSPELPGALIEKLFSHLPGAPLSENIDIDSNHITIRLKDTEVKAIGLGVVIETTQSQSHSLQTIHAVTPIDESNSQVFVSYSFDKRRHPFRTLLPRLYQGPQARRMKKLHRSVSGINEETVIKLKKWAGQFYEENNTKTTPQPISLHVVPERLV